MSRQEHRVRVVDVFTRADRVAFVLLAGANAGAVLWFAQRAWSLRSGSVLLAVLPVCIGLLSYEIRWLSLPLMRRPLPMPPLSDVRVAAVTSFVPGSESHAMLRRTLEAMVAMRTEHDTWVLDEGDDPDVRRMCSDLGVQHFSRRNRPEYQQASGPFAAGTKHGNYNAWCDDVGFDSYDVIAAFDPDHIPSPEFLERTTGYLADPRVGYVQAAQAYYNQPASLVARGAAEETYGYYSSVQMTAFGLGHPILTGCHNVNRSEALRSIGGFAPHDADDLLTTLHYRAAGWQGVYVPEVLALGLTPADWGGYLRQQRRWARSVLDVKVRRSAGALRSLPAVERLVASLHGVYYLHGLATASWTVLLAIALATGWSPPWSLGDFAGPSVALAVVLVACEAFRQRFHLRGRREWGLHLRGGLCKFAKWPWVLLALLDVVRDREQPFAVTPKANAAPRGTPLVLGHAPAVALVLTGAAIGIGAGRGPAVPVALLAAVYLALGTSVLLAALAAPAPPYDDALAVAEVPWTSGVTAPARTSEPPAVPWFPSPVRAALDRSVPPGGVGATRRGKNGTRPLAVTPRDPAAEAAAVPLVSVVIPAMNEAENLPHVFERLPADVYEVVLVDGDSTDDTVAVARSLHPDIRIVHQTGKGKGNALVEGFRAVTGDIVVMIDADGSTDAAEIPRFVAALCHGADFAKGSRFVSGGGSADITRLRRWGNRVLSGMVNVLFGTRYTDLCYGYNAFWRGCLPYLAIDCDGFEVETLINVRLAKAGMRVAEVPSYEHRRLHGVSNLNVARDGTRVLRTIIAERLRASVPIAPLDDLIVLRDGVPRHQPAPGHRPGAGDDALLTTASD